MVEVLKQPQYQPMPVANQVAVIYAVTNGFADSVAPKEIAAWEIKFHAFFNKTRLPLLNKIAQGEWDEKVEKELKEGCSEFGK